MSKLVYLVPLFPLLGFLVNGLFRKSLSKSMIGIIGSGAMLASFVVSLLVFFDVKNGGGATVQLFDFIHVGGLVIPFEFLVDPLSSLFLLIITGIGFLIHLYSTAYMHEEDMAQAMQNPMETVASAINNNSNQMAMMLGELMNKLNQPKQVVRDENGKIVGVQ